MSGRFLSLYVHIPFCVKKCNYCDFLSFPASEEVRKEYVDKLCEEIESEAALYPDNRVKSVFFGGGTPTVLSVGQLTAVLGKIKECFRFDADRAEITLECNPGTADEQSLKKFREAGFNRLSIGLQSARNGELRTLGRIHSYEDFLKTYRSARKAGFRNINIDVMSALPGQTLNSYWETLNRVLALSPEHISAYSLIIEEGTPFYEKYAEADRKRQRDGQDPGHLLPTEEEERAMYELTGGLLEKNGYYRYEISNYARPGYESRHNTVYWERGNYLGLGLGAASMVENCRFSNTDRLEEYLAGGRKRNLQYLTRPEQMEEFMFLGLRMMKGISCREFAEAFHTNIEDVYGKVFEKLIKQNLIKKEGDRIFLTKTGIDVSNTVLAEFLF